MALREFIGHNHPNYSFLGDYCRLCNCRYSKVAFAVPGRNNQAHPTDCFVHSLKAFGSQGVHLPTKCPAGSNNSLIYDGKWLEWFKLSLLHRDDLPHDLQVSKKFDIFTKEREGLDMSAVDATSKFLKAIWEHTHKEIWARVRTIDRFAQCHITITMTVPVIWPADARKRLYQAIQSADILGPNVRLARKFVTEAEAAGIALMSLDSVSSGNPEVGRANPRTTCIL